MSRKMEGSRLFCGLVLYMSFCGGLCQNSVKPKSADASIYIENSFLSLKLENKTLNLLTVHSDNVYTAGNNGLFHLSRNLEIESKHVTDEEENIYKILEVSESLGKLVACSSGGNRGCQLRNLGNVSATSASSNTAFHENVVASGEFRTVGMIAPGKGAEDSSLYVARSIDLTGDDRTDRPIFERKLMSSGNDDRQTNDMSTAVKTSFVIYYGDVFSYSNFIYYLASQRDDATRDDTSSPIVSKLSRICQNDESKDFKAFSELQLACSGTDGSIYSIIQSAHRMGKDLFIVFNKNGDEQQEYDPQPQSALCVYNLTELEEIFEENSYACACSTSDSYENSNNNYLSLANCGLLFTDRGVSGDCNMLSKIQEVRDMLPCAGDIKSTRFFAYPEEPQGQKVLEEALFESTGLTFTSISVTSAPRDDFHRIAFIGTKEGKLLKVNLNQTSCSNYEVVDIGSPILGDTTLYNNSESLLVLTESKLLKIKVAKCSQFKTCDECVRPGSELGDPYCGWCTLEKRCTRYDECQHYSENSRWLPYTDSECITIAKITPKALAREVHSQELQIRISHLPELREGESYECYFNDWRSVQTNVSGGYLNCISPPINEIPNVVSEDYVTMELYIFSSETGENFTKRAYEFYDCSKIQSCSRCVDGKWGCDWCKYEHRCSNDTSACQKTIKRQYGSSNTFADSCPQVLPGEKKYVPSGAKKSVTFMAKNLHLIGDRGIKRYECHLTAEDNCCAGVRFVIGATLETLDNVTFTVTCDSTMYSYIESQQTLDMKLTLKWNEENAVDYFQPVQLYKCEVRRSDCSRCLSSITTPENLNCIWCNSLNTCTEESMCDGPKTSRSNGECPAPVIDMVSPSSSTLEGGTIVTVTGSNLGKAFEEVLFVTLAGKNCTLLKDSYKVGERITCIAGPIHQMADGDDVIVQILEKSGTKSNCFSYKDPQVGKFSPESGPRSGGTLVNIFGEHLDTGGDVEVSIGGVPCTLLSPPTAKKIMCRTTAAGETFTLPINVTFDGTDRKFSGNVFSFKDDPTVESVEPRRSIQSGGNRLEVTGTHFELIQRTQIIVTFEEREIASRDCQVKSATKLSCFSPMLRHSYSDKVTIGFRMDGVTSLVMWTPDNRIHFQYYDDPQYFPFVKNRKSIKQNSQRNILIKGQNIDVASRKEDVKVYIGKEQCNITVFNATQLECIAPVQQPEAGDLYGNRTENGLPFVIVQHGFLEIPIGYVVYTREPIIYLLISIIVLLILFLVFSVLIISKMKRRSNFEVGIILKELEDVHNIVRNELKVFNDTLQMAVDNFDLSEKSKPRMTMIGRDQYVKNLLFSNLKINPDNEVIIDTKLLSADEIFFELVQNESFLISVISTMEEETDLSVKQRVNFASLITVFFLLKGQFSFLIHVTKILMAKHIRTTVGSKLSEEAFQGCGSVLNNIVSNIVRISLYDVLLGGIAEKLLQLQRAVKYIIEKGPIDAVTGKTQLSLSSSHLLTSQIEYEEITLKILFKYESIQIVELTFLSVDSITQVKNKILDHFFIGRQDQMLLSPDDFALVLHKRTDEKVVMRDDGILKSSNGWRRVNVIADYKVQNGDCVELVNNDYYNATYDGSMDDDELYEEYAYYEDQTDPTFSKEVSSCLDEPYKDLAPTESSYITNSLNERNTFDDTNTQSDSRDQSSIYESETKHMPKIWHLIRDENGTIDKPFDQKKDYHTKAVQDLTRSYLPVAGNMIQKYVKNVFDAFITSTEFHMPVIVKDIFDFFDRNAEKHRTPALGKKWKSNVLMLEVYSKVLSKPSLIYNIKECSYVQVCLDILAETLKQICTDEKKRQSYFPQNLSPDVQLFSHLVPVYKAKLDQYYNAIKRTKTPHPKMLQAECEKIEKAFAGTFDLLTVKWRLSEMLQGHKDKIYNAFRKDPELERKLQSVQIFP